MIAATELSFNRATSVDVIALLLALCVIAFSLWVFVITLKSRIERRWLWAASALVGVGGLHVTWPAGEVTIHWFTLQLLSAGLLRSTLGDSWLIVISLPIGALTALTHLQRRYARPLTLVEVVPIRVGDWLPTLGRLFRPESSVALLSEKTRHLIAGYEIATGLTLLVQGALSVRALVGEDSLIPAAAMIVGLTSVVAGVLLSVGQALGLGFSRILQGAQVVHLFGGLVGFGLIAGLDLAIGLSTDGPVWRVGWATFAAAWLNRAPFSWVGVEINLLPLLLLALLCPKLGSVWLQRVLLLSEPKRANLPAE